MIKQDHQQFGVVVESKDQHVDCRDEFWCKTRDDKNKAHT